MSPADVRPCGGAEATPSISVIVCTYNRSRLLRRALMAFATQAGAADAEIIVVDNNSTDDTEAVVRQCARALDGVVPVRYLHEPVQGLSRARNAGVRAARGEVVAFLDDDAVPHDGWLAAIAAFFADHPNAAAAGGPIEPEFETARPDWLTKPLEGYYSILELGGEERAFPRRKFPFGANMAIRRDLLAATMFSEQLGRKGSSLVSGEEFELFRQLESKGYKIYYLPSMCVTHFIPKERLNKSWVFERSRGQAVSRVITATGVVDKVRLLLWIVLAHMYYNVKALLQVKHDPLVHACKRKHYQEIYKRLYAFLQGG